MASFHYSKATVSFNFLAIRSVDATQTILVHQTSYVSILSSLGSIILGLLLTRLHRTALAIRHSGVDVQSSHSRHIDSLFCENGSGWHVSCFFFSPYKFNYHCCLQYGKSYGALLRCWKKFCFVIIFSYSNSKSPSTPVVLKVDLWKNALRMLWHV